MHRWNICCRAKILKENNMDWLYFIYFKGTKNKKLKGNLTRATESVRSANRAAHSGRRVCVFAPLSGKTESSETSVGFFFSSKCENRLKKKWKTSGGKTETQQGSIRPEKTKTPFFISLVSVQSNWAVYGRREAIFLRWVKAFSNQPTKLQFIDLTVNQSEEP